MSALATLYAIQTIGLTKRFGRTLALDQLSLTAEAGEVFGFLGPKGAGKSTTIRLLLGHLQPTAGQAWIFGDASGDATAAHRHLAYVPADVAPWPALSGAETLELLADIGPGIDRRYHDELMQRFELEVDRRCGTYSTGNRQKVALVAAFATAAPLLIFGEPTAGLNPVMEQQFRQCIAAAVVRGQTVFLSSHHLAEVEAVCQRVGILRDGRLVEVAELSDRRRLRLAEVDVSFRGAPPDLERLSGVPGVSNVRQLSPSRLSPDWAGAAGMIGVSVLLAGLGIAGFARRDLRG
jgi:ABC-2 type transport system ATP-binding protein